jgi:predicted glycosyltransferase involved in capsule biosynthesis
VNVIICSAWKEGDPWRLKAKEFIENHYVENIIYGESTGKVFNRAAALNACVYEAFRLGADVAFLVDADTFVSPLQLTEAAELALLSDRLVIAYDDYVKLSILETKLFYDKKVLSEGESSRVHVSGAIAVTKKLWEDVGGFDERFIGWGCEDRSFDWCCNALRGFKHSLRITGKAYHLWHPTSKHNSRNSNYFKNNINLAMRYKNAIGVKTKTGCIPEAPDSVFDVEQIKSILSERSYKPQGRILTHCPPT